MKNLFKKLFLGAGIVMASTIMYGSTYAASQAGGINLDFDIGVGFNGGVHAVAVQADGKVLVGGDFTTYKGVAANRIIRLNVDGTKDTSFIFGSGFDAQVRAIKIQSNGKIVVGGWFTSYDGLAANKIIRLNTDGTRDTSFVIGDGFGNQVESLVLQSDGKIVVGGEFTTYDRSDTLYIARLNIDGTLDNTFLPYFEATRGIYTLAVQSDEKILAGGIFEYSVDRDTNNITRLNSDGTTDSSFDIGVGFNDEVDSILLQSDGKIVVGGGFTSYDGLAANKIIRLNTDGTKDTSFVFGGGFDTSAVFSMAIQSDGKIIAGGGFTTYSGASVKRIARLTTGGTLDTGFVVGGGFENVVYALTLQSGGNILAGGDFTTYSGATAKYLVSLYGVTAPDTSIIYVNASITGGDGLTAETAFAKIQSGINAVSTGGTVHVAAGTYVEKISVSKSLTLQGANKDTTIINATGLAAHPEHTVVNFNLTSGNILFDGFTVNNGNNFDSVHYMMTNVSSIITISNNIFIPHGNPSEGDYDFGIINTANSSGKIIISSNSFINNFYYDPIHFGNFLGESDVEYNTIQVPIDTAGITYVTESNKHSTLLQSIHNNTLTHPSNEYSVNAILIESAFHNSVGGRFENIEILNNTINNVGTTKRGIQVSNDCSVGNGSGGEIISPRIQGNSINGNGGTNSRGLQLIGYITNANISGNTFTNLQEGIRVWDGAYTPGKFAVGTQIHNNSIVDSTLYSVNWLGSNILDATGNWFGESVESAISSKLSGNITYIPYYINADKTLFNTEAVTGDTATATSESPQVTLTDPEEAVTITIEDGVDNVTIDVSTFVSEGEGEIPSITINSPVADEMTVIIPATTVVSADTGWDGVISAPTVTTVTLPETAGQTKTLVTAIEIGYSEATLSFDDAVRIIFPGQAGKRVGYLPHDGIFTEITDTCIDSGSSLDANESCKQDVDGDLEVWTRHFTTFATYTQTTTTTSNGGGGGGGSSIAKDNCPDGDTSSSFYDGLCVTPKVVVKTLGGEVEGVSSTSGDISNSPYSTELNSAYLFAFQNGLTTIKNVRAANLNGSLYRKDMAKMMTNYAIKVLGKTPNTGTVCSFNDISSQSTETLFYAKLSCQLGIMGLEANGTPAKKFNSSTIVTRAEFGTALSRLLYGKINNHSAPFYYQDHLSTLKSAGILKNTQATLKETKGYAMLILMRATNK